MRLLINTSMIRFGGAVQVALSFIHECRQFTEHEFHVVVGPGLGAVLDPSDFPSNFHFHQKGFGVMGLRKLYRVKRELSAIEEMVCPDCVVSTSGPSYWRSQAPHLVGFNRPLFIYPESPYLKQLPFGKQIKLAAQRRLHCYYFRRDADALLVQTDDVNQRVRKLLRTNLVFTVTNNYNGWYDLPPIHPNRLPEKAENIFRFLTPTSYYPHKNLELIQEIIEELPERLRLRVEFVLTLTKAEYSDHISQKLLPQIHLIGSVPPPECPSLYTECDAMFMPTLAECFSASYPEAMKMGKPIITTDLGFARNICNKAALYFTACDARSAAIQIEHLVDDPTLRQELCKLGNQQLKVFDTPSERARKILEICSGLVR